MDEDRGKKYGAIEDEIARQKKILAGENPELSDEVKKQLGSMDHGSFPNLCAASVEESEEHPFGHRCCMCFVADYRESVYSDDDERYDCSDISFADTQDKIEYLRKVWNLAAEGYI